MERFSIGAGVDRDTFDPQLAASSHDTQSDLSPIGYQNFLEHMVLPILGLQATDSRWEAAPSC
jgi:hypothetical protein